MNVELRYLGHSEVRERAGGTATDVRLAPNLARPKVFYDGEVRHPVRFREAISALHDVVVGDLRFKKRGDKAAYQAWQKQEAAREAAYRAQVFEHAKKNAVVQDPRDKLPPGLEAEFRAQHSLYWTARRKWASELSRHDPELFRHLVPCDPVVTVAPDAVYFECFAKDESSYGCLLVERDGFTGETAAGLGTTNVDYSLALYDHFQSLRTYRPTRLQVDPTGFEVNVAGAADYREEKIDLPPSWLRGFGQIQAAMGLPSRRVELPVEAVYSLLAYLERHREKTGPRSIRFQLAPGRAPVMVLDPWNVAIPCRAAAADVERPEEIKVWGRRRLKALSRVLPLTEKVEVALLGSGLPSVWIAHMGEMRMVLALSGWTTNDWTSGSNLELLAGAFKTDARVVDALSRHLAREHRASLDALARVVPADTSRAVLLGSLHTLAKQGQVMFDFAGGVYRWRQVMPVVLSEVLLGPESPELVAAREMWRAGKVRIERAERLSDNRRLLLGKAMETSCEAMLDADGVFTRAKCSCSYFHRSRLRAGPCRHLLALRLYAQGSADDAGRGA